MGESTSSEKQYYRITEDPPYRVNRRSDFVKVNVAGFYFIHKFVTWIFVKKKLNGDKLVTLNSVSHISAKQPMDISRRTRHLLEDNNSKNFLGSLQQQV